MSGWTAPYGISCARMRSSKISNRGAARGEAYSHRYGYVKERFSIACRRKGVAPFGIDPSRKSRSPLAGEETKNRTFFQ